MNNKKIEKYLLKIIYFASAALLFTPLLVIKQSYFPYVYPKAIFIIWLIDLIVFAYLSLLIFNKNYLPKFKILQWLMVFYGFIYIVTSVFGLCFSRSWWGDWERFEGTYLILHLIAWLIVLVAVVKEKKDWHKLFKFSVWVSIAVALLGFLQIIGVNWAILPQADRIASTLGNAAFYSSYGILSLFLSLYLWLAEKSKKSWWYFIFAVVNFIAVVLTGTRGALIGIAVAGVYYLIFIWLKKIYTQKKHRFLFILGLVLIVFSLSLFGLKNTPLVNNNYYLSRFFNIGINTNTVQTRLQAWQYGWEGFKDNWLLGAGPENYNIIFNNNFSTEMYQYTGEEIWFSRAHNKLIDQAVMTGIFGILVYILIFIALFIYLRSAHKKKNLSLSEYLALQLLLIGYFIQNLFIFDNHSTYVLFFLVVGFIAVIKNSSNQENIQKIDGGRKYSKFIFLILIIAGFSYFSAINYRFIESNYYLTRGMNHRYNSPEVFHDNFQKAIDLSPNPIQPVNVYASEFADLLALGKFDELKKDQLINYLEKLYDYQGKISRLDSQNMFNSFQYFKTASNLYEETKNEKYLTDSKEIVEHSISLSPNNIRAYWQLFQYYYDMTGDLDKGQESLEKAIVLAPNAGGSYWLMAIMFFSEDQEELAYQYADLAIDKNYKFRLPSDIQFILPHYYDNQDWERSIKLASRLIELEPENIDVYEFLAGIYEQTGEIDLAINTLKRLIKMDKALTDRAIYQIDYLKKTYKYEENQ